MIVSLTRHHPLLNALPRLMSQRFSPPLAGLVGPMHLSTPQLPLPPDQLYTPHYSWMHSSTSHPPGPVIQPPRIQLSPKWVLLHPPSVLPDAINCPFHGYPSYRPCQSIAMQLRSFRCLHHHGAYNKEMSSRDAQVAEHITQTGRHNLLLTDYHTGHTKSVTQHQNESDRRDLHPTPLSLMQHTCQCTRTHTRILLTALSPFAPMPARSSPALSHL